DIAIPVLFGNKDKILAVAKEQGVTLNDKVEFVDPEAVRANYVDRLVELRKAKGMTPEMAIQMLQDNVALATMMIEANELDGLVSGAVHTTANTIRPPLQIIKTAKNAKLVSAIFFMLMPEQVYVYGDCALNIDPDAEQLSEIAIQSADTAKAFGIDPKVAMVTYSTMNSGKGADVDLMREATELVRQKRPDIAVDGPLQYDAAVMPNVAAQKAPNSPVAGKATVFIFPSLSTGNTVYKAVQRSANLVSIGPMLQGMRKPVNDLSRGALVDDIIYTIAVTAIQATQNNA
ncbi:MAG: phosphate acetyltransferase, partial [Succinivibrio sp.]|nr:phosphate acetyltransferase [Succinivibrio sp.]